MAGRIARRSALCALSWALPFPRTMTTRTSSPQPHPGFGSGSELWLARHGEVHGDYVGQEYGALDVPLSETGKGSSERLADSLATLRPARILSSPLQRARHLGEALAQRTSLELEVDQRLSEIDRGSWSGRWVEELQREQRDEVRAFYGDPWSWRGHGGENDSMLAERLWAALTGVLPHCEGAPLVLATHYNVARVLVSGALGSDPKDSFNLRLDPAHAVVLRDAPGGWQLLYSNIHRVPGVERT